MAVSGSKLYYWKLDCACLGNDKNKVSKSALLAICAENPLATSGFPTHSVSNTESIPGHDIITVVVMSFLGAFIFLIAPQLEVS